MATDALRSIDVAETATIDMMTLNNSIVSMRNTVKQARVRVVRKLIRQIQSLRNKKGTQEMVEKNKRKANRLVEEIHVIKHLKPDKISKFALGNTISFAELCRKDTASIESRALTRLSENQVIQSQVDKFRNSHPDWKSLSAFLLMKQSGRRYKKKRNKTTTEKIDTNIKARETMMQTYLHERLGSGVERMKTKDSDSSKIQEKKNSGKKDVVADTGSKYDSSEKKSNINILDSDAEESESERSEEDEKSESSAGSGGEDRLKAWGESDSDDSDGEGDTGTDIKQQSKASPSKNSSSSKTVENPVSQGKKENPKKEGLKIEVLKQMFSSRTSSSESDSEDAKTLKGSTDTKLRSRILKEMLPDESDSEDESEDERGESGSEDSTLYSQKNKLKEDKVPKSQGQQENRSGIMVVKKINLQDLENDEDLKAKVTKEENIPDILLSEVVPEVKKKKDAFFANSDESDDDDDDVELDEASSGENSEAEENEGSDGMDSEQEGKSSFLSTFVGTLAHKRKLKKGDFSGRGRMSDFRGRGSDFRGRGSDFRGRGSDFRGQSSNYRGQGDFRGHGGRGRSDHSGFRGRGGRGGRGSYDGRGRGSYDGRGRGSHFSGQGSKDRGRGSGFRGHSVESFRGQGRRENTWSNTDNRNPQKIHADKTGGVSKPEVLHPSWEASKRKKEQSSIHAFQGKKIKFDD